MRPNKRWKGFLAAFVASASVVLCAISTTNVAVDVKAVYRSGNPGLARFVREYVTQLRGTEFGMVYVPIERTVKLEMARQSSADCYVLGSSHEATINRQTFPDAASRCRELVNLWVPGGAYEDLLTFLGVLRQKASPITIYMGIAPWTLRRNADDRWSEFAELHEQVRAGFGLPPSGQTGYAAKLANLVNARYFIHNIREFARWRRDGYGKRIVVNAERSNIADDDAITLPDGSRISSRKFLAGTPPPEHAIEFGEYKVASPYVDSQVVAELGQVVSLAAKSGIRLILLLVPYHPKVMKCERARVCAAMNAVESSVIDLADRNGLPVLGSFDPRGFGLTWRDFYDDMHISSSAVGRVAALRRGAVLSDAGLPH